MNDISLLVADTVRWAKTGKLAHEREQKNRFFASVSPQLPGLAPKKADWLFDQARKAFQNKGGHKTEHRFFDLVDDCLGFTAVHRQKIVMAPFETKMDGYLQAEDSVFFFSVANSHRERKPAMWADEGHRLAEHIASADRPMKLICIQRDDPLSDKVRALCNRYAHMSYVFLQSKNELLSLMDEISRARPVPIHSMEDHDGISHDQTNQPSLGL